MNPPELNELVRHGGPGAMRGPRYGYWAWELPQAPGSWLSSEAFVKEIWATSQYTANAFKRFSKPVRAMPHPIIQSDYERVAPAPKRASFSAITFFDFNSSMARRILSAP